MHRSIVAVAALALSLVIADAAFAKFTQLHANSGDVANACNKVNGSYNANPDGYSCVKQNCDGKGGRCAVYCSKNGSCTGETPGIRPTKSKTFSTGTAGVQQVLTGPARSPTGAGGSRTGVNRTGVTTAQGGTSHTTFNRQSGPTAMGGGHHR